MEIASPFFKLATQGDNAAYLREVKDLIRRNDATQVLDGTPAPKRPRFSQDSGVGFSQDDASYHAVDGTIRSITLVNFMCHEHLHLKLNPKVNFLIGQNGSGKSAILTAITVGLGAHARETGRARSLKDLVMQGEKSAIVTIELNNRKKRRQLGGNVVSIRRTITEKTSQIQIKCDGKVVSTKMDFLHTLLRDMGIQINNPISVLDQNTSKTFLAQSSSATKYELFMRATALDDIQRAHEEINRKIDDISRKNECKKRDLKTKNELGELTKKYQEVEALVALRRERSTLVEECLWSKVNLLQSRLNEKQRKLESAKEECREHRRRMEAESEENAYAEDIARLEARHKDVIKNKIEVEAELKEVKSELNEIVSSLTQEDQDMKKIKSGMARARKFITDYDKQIEEQISLGDARERIVKQREMIKTLESQVRDFDTNLEVKEAEKHKIRAEATSLENEVRRLRVMKQESEEKKNVKERKMRSISEDASNLSIYGDFMPALVNRIDAAAKSFRRKPIGPFGMYVKLSDESWGPAVESVIGGQLSAFCVDNEEDSRKLKSIMRTVCNSANTPTVHKTRFFDRVHDTSKGAVAAPPHPNILNVLVISHPMVANLLIDKCFIERILLLPDDKTCQYMLSDVSRAPRNCYYAITPEGDTYYPAPMYRTYGGNKGRSARYLKASKEALLQTLKSEINEAVRALGGIESQLRETVEQSLAVKAKEAEVDRAIRSITVSLREANKELNELRNMEEPEESMVEALRSELRVREEELEELKGKLNKHAEEMDKLEKLAQKKKVVQGDLLRRLGEIKTEEGKIKEEKDQIEESKAKVCQQRDSRREVIENLTTLIKALEEEVQEFATKLGKSREEAKKFEAALRMQAEPDFTSAGRESMAKTRRKPEVVEKELNAMDTRISVLERKIGDNEGAVVRKYREMKAKTDHLKQILKMNESLIKALEEAMRFRIQVYNGMMTMNRVAIDNIFRKVLRQRDYKGSLNFENSKLEIKVGLSEDDLRSISTLSGGERSFGTMALLIALWYVTKLPFYFMDEFDVFMDMANRETIMALMMDYTSKRNYQFCFLTPLNTSTIEASPDVEIHRLDPPKRPATSE